MPRAGPVLKVSVFATGCAGIVAEYTLSTLATYLIGNAVFQWTLVMSLMLFSMGIGSRLSRYFKNHLIETFFIVEICISILCASSTVLIYSLSFIISSADILIYALSLCIGALIGFEIPLVTRLNESCEELRHNIASVMEKDYYGALIGGLFFAFVALPRLGLTYTPIILGTVNFIVAGLILIFFYRLIERKKLIISAFAACSLFLITVAALAKPIILFGEQKQYKDRVIYAEQTSFQKIVITRWKKFYWLFINGQTQFSSFDEEKYHEPLVHPAMNLTANRSFALILGGGDGLAAREILKYPDVKSVTIVDLDPGMTNLAKTHPTLLDLNRGSLNDSRVHVINKDAAEFLREDLNLYGAIKAKNISIMGGDFKVAGDFSKFYPVVFKDDGWNNGMLELEISRPGVHTDSTWRGSLISKFWCHSSSWGHGSDFARAEIHQVRQYFVAGYANHYFASQFIVWLRGGGTTYFWRSNHAAAMEDCGAGDKTLNGVKYAVKTAVDKGFDRDNIATYDRNTYYDLSPKGVIVMWNGSTPPEGWALCDGGNGTPNLKDKFILGKGSKNIGSTGGASAHTLTASEMPSHNHGGNSGYSNPSHRHGINTRQDDYNVSGGSGPSWGADNGSYKAYHSTISSSINHRHSISSQGGGKAHNNMPPYYVLAFIMKL